MKCTECKNCVLEDYGYSNYTVEGTFVKCGKRLHPDTPFDRFYGEEPKLNYADNCEGFEIGEPIYMDVDGEEKRRMTKKQHEIYKFAR